jgi:hypothetical protein
MIGDIMTEGQAIIKADKGKGVSLDRAGGPFVNNAI